MKIVHKLFVFLTLFTNIASFAMDCGICYEPISAARQSISMCPNKACAQANLICKACFFAWLQKNQSCPYGCGSNLKMIPSHTKSKYSSKLSSLFPISKDKKIFVLGACSVAALSWIAHYWSKYSLQSTLHAIKTAAQIKTDMLLNFEFDCDNGTFLGLQESFDINLILSALKTERQRITLKTAIEHYDSALCNTYNRIVSSYYYQSATKFEEKELELVQELRKCTEEINRLTTSYTEELGSPLHNMFIGVGVGMLSGIGILNIV